MQISKLWEGGQLQLNEILVRILKTLEKKKNRDSWEPCIETCGRQEKIFEMRKSRKQKVMIFYPQKFIYRSTKDV